MQNQRSPAAFIGHRICVLNTHISHQNLCTALPFKIGFEHLGMSKNYLSVHHTATAQKPFQESIGNGAQRKC